MESVRVPIESHRYHLSGREFLDDKIRRVDLLPATLLVKRPTNTRTSFLRMFLDENLKLQGRVKIKGVVNEVPTEQKE